MAASLKVLADPSRLRLVSIVASHDGGDVCVCELTEPLALSQPTASHHLKILVEAGFFTRSQRGQWAYYRLVPGVLDSFARLIDKAGWQAPAAKRLPFGRDLVTNYLLPLSETSELAACIHSGSTVTAVARQGMDRTRPTGREKAPFLLRVQTLDGGTEHVARAVPDASGTYGNPNGVLSSGLQPAASDARAHITHALPDALGTLRHRFAGKYTLVVGAGHSAANTLLKLAQLADEERGTTITWAVRAVSPVRVYGSDADELTARGELGSMVHEQVRAGRIALVDRFEIDGVSTTREGRVEAIGRQRRVETVVEADIIVNATGFGQR